MHEIRILAIIVSEIKERRIYMANMPTGKIHKVMALEDLFDAPIMPACKPPKEVINEEVINEEVIETYIKKYEHIPNASNSHTSNTKMLKLIKYATYLLAESKANAKYITRLELMNDKLLGGINAEV